MSQDFGDADDREITRVDDGVAAGVAHALAADAEKLERRVATAQGLDELGAIHFTGSLPGGDQDSHGGHCKGQRECEVLKGGNQFSKKGKRTSDAKARSCFAPSARLKSCPFP